VTYRKSETARISAAMAIALGATTAALAEPTQQLGPFKPGMTTVEARQATPGVAWTDDVDEGNGKVVGASAANAWTFDGLAFDAVLRPSEFGAWSLALNSHETADTLKDCRKRMKSLTAQAETSFGRLDAPAGAVSTSAPSISVQRIGGYPVVVGQPGVSTGKETFSAGEDSRFAVMEEGDNYAEWLAVAPSDFHAAFVGGPGGLSVKVEGHAAEQPNANVCRFDVKVEVRRSIGWRGDGGIAAAPTFGVALAQAFEPIFVAEFPTAEAEAARSAWLKRGDAILRQIQGNMYPAPETAEFTANALAALRAKRKAEPAATMNDLIDAALKGSGKTKGAGISVIKRVLTINTVETDAPPPAQKPAVATFRTVGGVNVLRIKSFEDQVSTQVAEALRNVKNRVVLDLRGNGGGLFADILDVGSILLGPKKTVATLKSSRDEQEYRTVARGDLPDRTDLALVVLIDGDTNSGGLMLTAALADHGRARIAGAAADAVMGYTSRAVPFMDFDKSNKDTWLINYPTGVIVRPNGAPLAEGVKVDRPVKAEGDAAIAEAAKALAKP
jgi:hypothetical protein